MYRALQADPSPPFAKGATGLGMTGFGQGRYAGEGSVGAGAGALGNGGERGWGGALPVKKRSHNHGDVEQDPAQARQVDILVAFLYAVP